MRIILVRIIFCKDYWIIPDEDDFDETKLSKRWDYLWYDRQVYLKESWKTDSQGPNQGKADVRCCPVRASLLTVITIALFFLEKKKNEKKNIALFNIFIFIIIVS